MEEVKTLPVSWCFYVKSDPAARKVLEEVIPETKMNVMFIGETSKYMCVLIRDDNCIGREALNQAIRILHDKHKEHFPYRGIHHDARSALAAAHIGGNRD